MNESELSGILGLLQRGDPAAAEKLLAARCAQRPADAGAWFYLGVARHQRGELEAALAAFERATAAEPANPDAWNAQAAMLSLLDRPRAALTACERAMALRTGDPQFLTNAGAVLEQLERLEDALECYDRVLAAVPEFLPALLNRGAVLTRLGRLDDALANNDRLAVAHPGLAAAHFNRAEVLLALNRAEEALEACGRALALDARHVGAHIDRGLALSVLGRVVEAQRAFDTARGIDPARYAAYRNPLDPRGATGEPRFDPREIYLTRMMERQRVCDWRRRDELVSALEDHVRQVVGTGEEIREISLAFNSLALPLDPGTRRALAGGIARHVATNAKRQAAPGYTHEKRLGGRIRVGYLSPDFRRHPIGMLTQRLYALHERSGYAVYAYSLHSDDGSEACRNIRQGCDVFREIPHLSAREAASFIHYDRIDVLVDLAGYTTHAKPEILARRPAPLQVNYLGNSATTGAEYMDYALVDATVCPPGAERHWSERLVYLPGTCYVTSFPESLALPPGDRQEAGLPRDCVVFCCFNNPRKIEPRVFGIWMRILRRVPDSVLWLFGETPELQRNLAQEAQARGIPAARLIFAPFVDYQRYLSRYRLADLFLDTPAYNAHTTAAEALWAGLPVLTCPGEALVSRVAASLLQAAGLPEMIVSSPEDYEHRAVHLATHPAELAAIRGKLAANQAVCPLFNTELRVRELEAAYRIMWERHLKGQPPESFHLPPLA